MNIHEKYKSLFDKYGINTPLRIAHFMAQIEHESGLKPISENLNYSKLGLLNTFGKYFSDDVLDKDGNIKVIGTATLYARKPEKIANRVYANRIGNGNEASGEGWKYRGRGFIQITGKENYFRLANDTDLDCLKNPDLLLEEANAMISALWFWNLKKLNIFADKDDIISITKKINGGLNGIEHRKQLLKKYKLCQI
jgi:putative chitinase